MLTVKLDDDLTKRLDALAKKADISRHQLMINMLSVGIEELELFSNLGFFKVNAALGSLHRKFKKLPEETTEMALKLSR